MPELTEAQRLDIKWAIDSLSERVPAYRIYSEYYAGKHRFTLASPEHEHAFGSIFGGFCENLCATVVDVLKDRLKLTDFTHDQKPEDPTQPDAITDKILDIWRANRMDERQGEVYLEALKTGDAYVVVWPDDDNIAQIDPNEACLVTVQYSDKKRGMIDKAAKLWPANDKFGRLNLYYPDRVEKFRTQNKVEASSVLNASSFQPFVDDGEFSIPNPYGQVPVFHFRNNAPTGKFGTSELAAAIPSQDRLNKTIIDGLVKSEEWALPVRWALGFETPKDPRTNEPILGWKPGDWWISRQKEGSLGQLPGADLKQFIAAADDARMAIARVTRTPQHYFQQQGVTPSGEALKTEDAPLTAKVRDRQITFGNTWEDVFTFALKVMEAIWANTEPRDDTAEIANQIQKVDHLGFSKKQALRELEYSDAEIEKLDKEKKDESAAAPVVPPTGQPNNEEPEQVGAVQ
jgi:hypothetical protein